jgi:hypothetical protein
MAGGKISTISRSKYRRKTGGEKRGVKHEIPLKISREKKPSEPPCAVRRRNGFDAAELSLLAWVNLFFMLLVGKFLGGNHRLNLEQDGSYSVRKKVRA